MVVLLFPFACGPTASSESVPETNVPDAAPATEHPPEASTKTELSPSEALYARCPQLRPPKGLLFPNYAPYNPNIASHCYGTNHQDIQSLEQVVFLGDSITRGTPPTQEVDYYRWVFSRQLFEKYGKSLEIKECSKWGARVKDLLEEPDMQIARCFPDAVEPKSTLIVMTMGGNDMHQLAKRAVNDGIPFSQVITEMEDIITKLRTAIMQLKDPKRFPKGSYVLFANVYEFTDGVGDILSCPVSQFGKLNGPWPDMYKTYVAMNERMVKLAVETQTDIIFLQEHFCGHGLHSEDSNNACYKGKETEHWFDPTCIHPTPEGHAQIAKMFWHTLQE